MGVLTVVGKEKLDFSRLDRYRTIIGSRKASPAVCRTAYEFACQSVLDGYIVVSGLALGVDTAAHEGALSVHGDFPKTVAVLSTSFDEGIYPSSNAVLANNIQKYGCLIYCYKTKAPWTKERFGPKQKRLVERDILQAYLSLEIVVVSDDDIISGGSRWALNYGSYFGRKLYRLDSRGIIHKNFAFKREPNLISWETELDWRRAVGELLSGDYDFIKI